MRGAGPGRRLASNLGGLARWGAARLVLPRGQGAWLRVRLTPALDELPTPALFSGRETSLALVDLLSALDRARSDARLDGLFVELAGGARDLSSALALRRALAGVEAAGKPVVAWGESLTATELLLASAARRLWLAPAGGVQLVGMRLSGVFLRGLLERVGVRPEVVRVGAFKTAGEALTRDAMSPEQREQLDALLEDRFTALVEGVAEGRGLEPDRVRALVDEGPFAARAAVEAGLADGCLHRDEIPAELEKLAPPRPEAGARSRRPRLLDAATYHALCVAWPAWRPLRGDLPRLAYVVARGSVRRGSGYRGIASEAYGRLFAELGRDPGVRAVVLRVDSPGGDAVASDALWRSVERLRRRKPVVASFAEVAASGGYYLAAAADAVLAERTSVTGSIGVVGGKLDLSALYERIGVARDGVERGARAGLVSEARGFTPDERAALRESMQELYALFLERVASGRAVASDALERIARGRIWSGAAARRHGLVDALGGPLEALAEARSRAGLLPDEPALLESWPRVPRLGNLGRLLVGRADAFLSDR